MITVRSAAKWLSSKAFTYLRTGACRDAEEALQAAMDEARISMAGYTIFIAQASLETVQEQFRITPGTSDQERMFMTMRSLDWIGIPTLESWIANQLSVKVAR